MSAVNESAKTTFFHILNYLESQSFPSDVLQPLALHVNFFFLQIFLTIFFFLTKKYTGKELLLFCFILFIEN